MDNVPDKTAVCCSSDFVVGMMWSPWGSRAKWWKPWDWNVSPKDVLKIFISEEGKAAGYVFPKEGEGGREATPHATSFPGTFFYFEKVPWVRLVTCLLDFSRFQRCDWREGLESYSMPALSPLGSGICKTPLVDRQNLTAKALSRSILEFNARPKG